MKITFLGTGTSTGVPQVGCNCKVCTSTDPRDKRLRTSAIIEEGNDRILMDCGPDFRQQILTYGFKKIQSIFITHEHYDHVGGLDDLRPYNVFGDINIYCEDYTLRDLKERLPYCFKEHKYPGVPNLNLIEAHLHESVQAGKLRVLPFRVMHGKLPILGFRVNNMAYITDLKTLPDSEWPYLENLDLLVVNALRHEPHPSHQTIEEAIDFAQKLQVKRVYLVHMSHHMDTHAVEEAQLPEGFHFAYDGLTVEC